MIKIVPTFLLVLFASLAGTGQTAVTSPTPPPADDGDVVKISTNLIQIDVTVTDRSGRIVPDLRPEEFEVFENGQRQQISNFSFVSNVREQIEAPGRSERPAVVLPPPSVRPEQVRRTIALVVDDLTLSFESVHYTRRALKKFVDQQMHEGDLVAIIRTGAGIGALQQFTTDRRQLYAAIERIRWNPVGNGGVSAFTPLQSRPQTGREEEPAEPGERTQEGIEREFNDFRESVFASGTLGAINYVVRGMRDLPGRKSIMLLSDGFSLFAQDAQGFRESSRILESLRRLVDAANRAAVVIYTLDARGLAITGLTAADDTSGRSAADVETALSERRNKLFDTQDGLRYLAVQTGGISITNNNDLSGGIRRILDDQSYYLIGYQPDDDTFDPRIRRFNKLQIKVNRPGVKVRYRSGFFGVSDEKLPSDLAATGGQRLREALTSPFAANQVALRLNTLFGSNAGNSYVRSLLHVRAQDIKFEDLPDGSKKAVFDVLAVAFGDNGAVVDQISKTYTFTTQKEAYERLMREGFVYDFSFPMKKAGAYQLRVAIRDHGTERVGSANQFIEVPNLKKERLVISGVALENVPFEEWGGRQAGKGDASRSNALIDTSLRQFRVGTVLIYGFSIFNFRPGSPSTGNLGWRVKLFRDGRMIFEGSPQSVASSNFTGKSVDVAGSLSLGTVMTPGDYVMQISVTDKLAKEKRQTAHQFVQFEIVK
ncbi:MAG: VWA domain-containing protein [Acidobacteria bacterium]|nr:VWA domain-containing protein [Acidobacteriota bacterium]